MTERPEDVTPWSTDDGADSADVTEQTERQRRLEAVFEHTSQFTCLLEPDGTVVEANDRALSIGDLDRDAILGRKLWDTDWWATDERARDRLCDAVEQAGDGASVRYEARVRDAGGPRKLDFAVRPVTDEDGDVELLVAEGRDVTELHRREEQLELLNDLAQDLTETEGVAEICDIAVSAAEETLGLDLAAVERYDEDSGALESCARTASVTELLGDRPLFDRDQNRAWQTYLEHEGTVYEDLRAQSGAPETGTPLDSAIVLPLGRHGVFIAGSTTPDAFTDADVDLARILAAHVEVAMDRVEREHSLRERSATLEAQTEHLDRLTRITDVFCDLLGSVVAAATRAEIQTETCDCLSDDGPYPLAWFGTLDPVSGELRPEAVAGRAEGYVERITVTPEEDGDVPAEVTARMVHTGDVRVVDRIRTEPPFAPWQQAALDYQLSSAIAVPVAYEGTKYGVLAVYGDEPDQFEAEERAALARIGSTVGYAITAATRKAALVSDHKLELRFEVTDPADPLLDCLGRADGELELEGVVGEGDGFGLYFTIRDGSPDNFCAAAADSPGVRAVERISGDPSECLVKCVPVEDSVVDTIFEHGAGLGTIESDGDGLQIRVEFPGNHDVRAFAEMFESRYPGTTLVARRERDGPIQTARGFHEELADDLTDRQLEALKTAYYSGFFEWPRENAGQEVAEMLDVSQPTFNRHLRAGQRKLFDRLFED